MTGRGIAPLAMMTARVEMRAVVEFDRVGFAVAGEPSCAFRDHDLRAEFLRLRISAPGEFLSGNAGRKAEVVFDLRARAGLAPGRFDSSTRTSNPSDAP